MAAALLAGCETYEEKSQKMAAAWGAGDYALATKYAKKNAEDAGLGDRLLTQLEWGAAERGAGNFQESLAVFNAAAETLEYWDARPDVLLSNEILSAINNMTSLPYRGTAYDRIMLSTYQALNFLALGDVDAARVALNQALNRQTEAVQANAKRIARAETEAANAGNEYDVERARNNPQFDASVKSRYAEVRRLSGYADYVNPFSVWLHGVFFLANATGGGELERARKSLERAALLAPGCEAAQADFAQAEALASAGAVLPGISAVTYLIFETGVAPSRWEDRIDIPLFIVSNTVPYVGAAVPNLAFKGNYASSLVVSADKNDPVRTQTLVSMDSVIATDFNNALPEIITRTLINTGIKATASYVINNAAKEYYDQNRDDPAHALVYLATTLFTGAYSYATTRADLRTWRTLPKEFQIARMPTPPDRRLRLLAGQSPAVDVELIPGSVNVVYVKSTGVGTPLTVSQFDLKPSARLSDAGAVPPEKSDNS